MTQVQSKVFRIVLFSLGLGLILLFFFLFKPEVMEARHIFMWVNIAVLYCIFMVPFLFVSVSLDRVDSKTPFLVLLWIPILVFESVGILLTVLTAKLILSINVASLIESLLLFGGLVLGYFGIFTGSHIRAVKEDETQALETLKHICSAADMLSLKATSLNDSYAAEKKQMAAVAEEVHYLSPVHDLAAAKFEQDILCRITSVSSLCDTVIAGSDGSEFKKQIAGLELVVKQRKAMKN